MPKWGSRRWRSPARDCGMQFDRQDGGNKDLEPEKSDSITAGLVFQPTKNLVFTLDYFDIKVKNQITAISETAIFGDPEKYADKFVRNADGSIHHIITTKQNLGGIKTSGFDVGMAWRSPMTSTGQLGFNIDGTYITDYQYQEDKGMPWVGVAGSYAGLDYQAIVLRWKHTANLDWRYENWALNLQQSFSKGYKDQNSGGQNHKVSDYTTYNLSGTYKGFKNLELTLGVKNMFDEAPLHQMYWITSKWVMTLDTQMYWAELTSFVALSNFNMHITTARFPDAVVIYCDL